MPGNSSLRDVFIGVNPGLSLQMFFELPVQKQFYPEESELDASSVGL
jgi:hypothetical protein